MIGDITIYQQGSAQGGRGTRRINVAATASIINPGEPVFIVAGASAAVYNQTSNLITVTSPYVPYATTGTGLLGIAETKSTNTASLAGYVDYVPATSTITWLCVAQTPSLINTQAKYDALVGARVLLNVNTPGISEQYTMLLTDSALNGFIVQPLDIFKYPNMVAFIVRDEVTSF